MRIESLAMPDLPPDPLKVMDENLRALEEKRETLEKEIAQAEEELCRLKALGCVPSTEAAEG